MRPINWQSPTHAIAPPLEYRPALDGLRAVAVLSVLLYHLEFSAVSGGFAGVDVFFVISGYLITRIICSKLAENTFSVLEFYEKRIRRIFPALAVMLIFTVAAASVLLLPSQMVGFPATAAGTLTFVSNFVFWQQTGYFAESAETKPLLHTWSLGVEEQFYLLAPWAFLILARFWPHLLRPTVLLGVMVSFGLSVHFSPIERSASFFLLPARAWELLVGSCCALGLYPWAKQSVRTTLAAVGLVLILASVFILDSTTAFPGYAAALPVGGTFLVIAYGAKTPVDEVLSPRPLVFIGLISYSVYLWHWPLVVFGRMTGVLGTSLLGAITIGSASIVLGVLSWWFVERPFRTPGTFGRTAIFRLSAGFTAAMLCVATALHMTRGWPERFSPQVAAFDAARADVSPLRDQCHRKEGLGSIDRTCVVGGTKPTIAVWSDSHGVELGYALATKADSVRLMTYSSCPPALGFEVETRPQCAQHNDLVIDYLRRQEGIEVVVLGAYWEGYAPRKDFPRAFTRTVKALKGAGKQVVVIGPVPKPETDVPKALARGAETWFDRTHFRRKYSSTRAFLKQLERAGAVVFRPGEVLCRGAQCPLLASGKPLLFDKHHLSLSGASWLAPYVREKVTAITAH